MTLFFTHNQSLSCPGKEAGWSFEVGSGFGDLHEGFTTFRAVVFGVRETRRELCAVRPQMPRKSPIRRTDAPGVLFAAFFPVVVVRG